MKRILIFLIVAFLGIVGVFAQTDFFYSPNGRETFTVRKDRIVMRTTSTENVNALSAQMRFQSTHTVGYDMIVATIDTMSTTFENLRQLSDIVDATFALEYADGTVQMPTNRIFVQFREGQTPEEVFRLLSLTENIKAVELINEFDEIYMVTLDVRLVDILQTCRDLFRSNLVVFAEPVFIREVQRHNPLFSQQWGLRNTGQHTGRAGIDIRAEQAWSITRGNSQIRVAVLDEGVDLLHPDLRDNLLPGFDATVNPPSGANGSPHGNNAHGTACAGIIAAKNNDIGIVGVAPNVSIIPIRIAYDRFDIGWWTTEDLWIINGIRYAWQTAQADVLSNSWGGGSESLAMAAEITAAVTNGRLRDGVRLGSVVVFSTGNNDASTVSFPANLANVIAVGAMSQCGERKSPTSCDGENWWGSNFGTTLNIVAPGVLIPTTDIRGSAGYAPGNYVMNFNGTSAAAPHVAGVAALILSVNPNLTQAQVRHAIESTATKIRTDLYTYSFNPQHPNGTWNNQVGHGLVNAYEAVKGAIFGGPAPTLSGPSAISPATNCEATFIINNLPTGVTDIAWNFSHGPRWAKDVSKTFGGDGIAAGLSTAG